MSRAIYFDCFSGASGDMLLGALVDCGVAIAELEEELASLALPGWRLAAQRVQRAGLAATKVSVLVEDREQPHRRLATITDIVQGSALPGRDKERALTVFRALADAEATVHGTAPEQIEFHEVGAVDSIVDVIGTVAGLRLLGVEECFVSELPVGAGQARTQHGVIPVPGPATLALLARA